MTGAPKDLQKSEKLGFFKAVMIDGKVFRIHRDCMEYAKSAFAQYHGR